MLTDFLSMGQRGRNPNPFAPPPAYTTPGIGDSLPGAIPMGPRTGMRPGMFGNPRSAAMAQGHSPEAGAGFSQPPISLMPSDAMPEQANALPGVSAMPGIVLDKPGFFDKGGGWRDALGILSDALAGAAGQAPVYTQMKLQQRKADIEAQRRAQEEKARRSADRDTWLWQQQWKQQHPDDQFTQFMVAGGIDPRSPQGQALYKQRAEGMAAPPLMAVDGFDAQGNPTKTFMPRPTFAPGQSTSAGPTVGTTRNGYRFKGGNPNDRSSWEPVEAAPSATRAAPSSGGAHMTVEQYRSMRQSMGQGYEAWSRKYAVPVLINSPEEMGLLPIGTPFISPDGRRGVTK